MSILFVFVDGMGIGPKNPFNPLSSLTDGPLAALGGGAPLMEGFRLIEADACLDVPGLPQSATGGTSLFTGVNAPKRIGSHKQGYPGTALREIIASDGMLRKARELGAHVDFANAYTPAYFERGRTRHRSVTTVTVESAGIRLKSIEDLRLGEAVYRDFSNHILCDAGYDAEPLSSEKAGARLGRLAKDRDLLVYEYFQTDIIGHRGTIEDASELISSLNRFLSSAIEQLDVEKDTFVLSSDHGNIEDMENSSHTFNPVPILLWGEGLDSLDSKKQGCSICDVAPGVISLIQNQ